MKKYLVLSFLFPHNRFHGCGDWHELEWPPSPFRVYAALVASSGRMNSIESDRQNLEWLEQQSPPQIIAPVGIQSSGYALSVPSNERDICVGKGKKDSFEKHKAIKDIKYTSISEDSAIYYIWEVSDDTDILRYAYAISNIARHISHLGWGEDVVIPDGQILTQDQVDVLDGEHWYPDGEICEYDLRTPVHGALDDLKKVHKTFLDRLKDGEKHPVESFEKYKKVRYRRPSDLRKRKFVSFKLVDLCSDRYKSFDTTGKGLSLSGMIRHVVEEQAVVAGRDRENYINPVILGHGTYRGYKPKDQYRFAYLPIPSIEPRGNNRNYVGDIRRFILTSFSNEHDMNKEIDGIKKRLYGSDLVNKDGEVIGIVEPILGKDLGKDDIIKRYIYHSDSWSTVTPVVLPGFDEKINSKTDGLLRKSIIHAGFPEFLADNAKLEWRKTGFLLGTKRIGDYGIPKYIKEKNHPLYHVHIEWKNENGDKIKVPGPICLGDGRFRGIGLFVAD
jgi:CRISPR-associated protein Csb2